MTVHDHLVDLWRLVLREERADVALLAVVVARHGLGEVVVHGRVVRLSAVGPDGAVSVSLGV